MENITDSRLNAYRGIVALAWADHALDDNEIEQLHLIINSSQSLSQEQKDELIESVKTKSRLSAVWDEITEKQDRAFVINIADRIFHADGEYCGTEKNLYDRYIARHLDTLDIETMREELSAMALIASNQREVDALKMEEYQEHFSIVSCIKRLLT